MHGLIYKAIECFVTDAFGAAVWADSVAAAGLSDALGGDGFDALQVYDDAMAARLLAALGTRLGRDRDALLEDLGTYLVSHPRTAAIRRLMRFGGVGFADFLVALDDLQGRARLAVPAFELPAVAVREVEPGRFRLDCLGCPPGFGHVMIGILRAMADDYGALVMLDHLGRTDGPGEGGTETLAITLHDPAFHAGRQFDLAAGAGG